MIRSLASGLFALALTAFLASAAAAGGPVNKTLFGNAIDGYDPAAYHLDGMPVEGSKNFTYEWMGATWRFANMDNRDLFAADPAKYAPAFGGYCAYGVAKGNKVGFDPMAWKIVEGRLCLNLNANIQKKWQKDIPGFIAMAEQKWPKLKDK
jgi:YHS domain-containing protein